jgi:hypothetical protein
MKKQLIPKHMGKIT